MALTLDYPDNWSDIAATVKQAAGYRCNRCGLKCLPPHNSYRHLDLSLRRKLSAQVHHLDGNPAQNDTSNLVCLCSVSFKNAPPSSPADTRAIINEVKAAQSTKSAP